MVRRDDWLEESRQLDWEFTYVREEDVFPEAQAGRPFLPASAWRDWDEPYKTTYAEYVATQHEKDVGLAAVCDAVGRADDFQKLAGPWLSALKLHSATLALAEFASVVGNLRGARFGRHAAWRTASTLGALDEFRHTQIPLLVMHELLRFDPQFDWTHRFYHTNNWVAIASRHAFDELLTGSDALEFAVGTHAVFETGFTNLQFVGLSALARDVGDRAFERLIGSIQTDEARHAQIGLSTLEILVRHDKERVQYLLDKWFWRSWLLFAVVTGFAMDYLTPLQNRKLSFKEFVEEWVVSQYLRTLARLGLERPWYWDTFLESLENYHHMVYASAYTYRATVWFDMVVPSPQEREWLGQKYPGSWPAIQPAWEQVDARWKERDPGNDLGVMGTSIIGFCELCQLVLCGGTPSRNTAVFIEHEGQKKVFCSEPCRWIFEREPERYAGHRNVVKRVLAGEAPANLLEMLTRYFGLTEALWGHDLFGGDYPWIRREDAESRP
jgi:toluene monooxygenase system protein A